MKLTALSKHPFIEKCLIRQAKVGNCLCAGIDPDLDKLPSKYSQDLTGLEQFLLDYISFANDHVIAFKPNISFFEALGLDGLRLLERVMKAVSNDIPIIIDAKRGDIGNTAKMQAKFIYDYFNADATTLHPYMGSDSVVPFFEYKDKFNFVLVLTSNPSHTDFETRQLVTGEPMYKAVLDKCDVWQQQYNNVGCVVGATHNGLADIRVLNDSLLFLLPGVGAQGAKYADVYAQAQNKDGLCLINVSRGLMYANQFDDATILKILKN